MLEIYIIIYVIIVNSFEGHAIGRDAILEYKVIPPLSKLVSD